VSQVVIENPILNSPYEEPSRHFRFDQENSITNEVVSGRRPSTAIVPVARPRSRRHDPQQMLPGDFSQDRAEPNKLVNDIRLHVGRWRQGGHSGVTATTRRLLDYWRDPARDRKLFFCQIEALETAIYLSEVSNKFTPHLQNELRDIAEAANPGLRREAFKMATGSGKTVVMAMIIAWQALNKHANPQDARFTDAFLIVTPGMNVTSSQHGSGTSWNRLASLLPTTIRFCRARKSKSRKTRRQSWPATTRHSRVSSSSPRPMWFVGFAVRTSARRKTFSFSTTKPIIATARTLNTTSRQSAIRTLARR
jgi:Type III restriction enzyme, res subunit